MWPSLQPSPRPSLRFIAQLGAGLLVPMWVAPAMAQGVAVITPSPAMAPRDEREKLAPVVMAPAAAEAMRAEGAANQLAWRESLKRMSEAEADDPSRALAAYKRFFNERTMSPALGVEVGLKIAQLRSKLGDSQGALQTCEVLGAKYADEPTAVLLTLEKARVLMGQKQLASASEAVNAKMPELVALGPSRYREISDLLLKLVQTNLDSGDAEGKERAKALCVGVEEIYLRWVKLNTADHLWKRFEFLQNRYQQAGDVKRANQLLQKLGDALLKAPVEQRYVEGAATTLITNGRHSEARELLDTSIEGKADAQLQMLLLSLKALSFYQTMEFEMANVYAQQVIDRETMMGSSLNSTMQAAANSARSIKSWTARWEKTPILMSDNKLVLALNPQERNEATMKRHLVVRTLQDVALTASVDDLRLRVYVISHKRDNNYFVQKEVVLEVPTSLQKSIDVTLTVSSLQISAAKTRIPVHIEVPSPIQVSSPNVFFGETTVGASVKRTITFSSIVPFRVLEVVTGIPELEFQSPSAQHSKEQNITLIFTPSQVGRFYNGTIRIRTDMPQQEVIELPYVARSK